MYAYSDNSIYIMYSYLPYQYELFINLQTPYTDDLFNTKNYHFIYVFDIWFMYWYFDTNLSATLFWRETF